MFIGHYAASMTARAGAQRLTPYPREPKIALPTRTSVAPCTMAFSKSPLMPMERRRSPSSFAMARSMEKCAAGSSSAGGMHISPST